MKNEIINKAIAENDAIILNGETVCPIELDGDLLFYYDQSFQQCRINIVDVIVDSYEKKV